MRRFTLALVLGLAGCTGLTPTPTSFAEPGSGDVVVPDLIGRTPEEAAALVAEAGFSQAMESTRPVECEGAAEVEGRINCQSPAAGATVKRYTVVQVNVYRPTRIAGAVVRDQMLALIGMTPDEAREALAGYGHDGKVRVMTQSAYDPACGAEVVCGFDRPESGMGLHDAITLYVNPPPPE